MQVKWVVSILAGLFVLTIAFGTSLAAQDKPDANASGSLHLAGVVHAADGATVPGSTIRVIQTSTGKAWVSWTDENGKFEFPALPPGHYRVETSQLGFAPASKEIDLPSDSQPPLDMKLDVGTLAAITAPPAAPESAEKTQTPSAPPSNETAQTAPPVPSTANPGAPASSNQGAAAASNSAAASPRAGYRGGYGGRRAGGPGGGQRAFQQVDLNAQNQNAIENPIEDETAPEAGGQLGQAASTDAVQMIGTVAMGQTAAQLGGFPQQQGGPQTGETFGNDESSIPGQAAPNQSGPGGPGSGGFGGGFAGGPRSGGGGRAPRGPLRGPQGITALYGAQRIMRQRINRVHYSFYDTYGNSALNARPYSLTQVNPPKISSWTESAGFNIGGPLKIPHIYDGSDRTFFFVNFGGSWSRSPVDSFATVPTSAERAGDFSNIMLYNPATSLPFSGCPSSCSVLPATLTAQEQISQNLLTYIPLPNVPCPNQVCPTLNYHLQTNLPGLSNRLNVNVSHQVSSKLSLHVNYNLSNQTMHTLSSFPGIEGSTFTRGQSVMIGLTQNYTKTFMHTSTLYFSRSRSLGLNEFSNLTPISTELGITGISSSPFDYGLPSIGFTNFTGLSDTNPSLNRNQTYRYVDSLSWMKSKHTVTVGGEVRKMDIDRDTDPAANGQFSFTGQLTSFNPSTGGCDPALATTPCGNDFADFLLGYPANAKVQFGNTSTYFRNWGFVGYASDDWHMFPRFTMTYGVRYEAFTPPTEIENRIANLDVSSDFTQVQCVTPIPTGNCIAGPSASLFHGHYNNWAPRLGIAWQPPGKWFTGQHQMTIRAGYSMFYVESYLNTLAGEMANQPPFATANTLTTQTVTNPPLSFLTNLQSASPAGVTNTVAVNPNYQVPYAMIWNASIEYNLIRNTFLEVIYTGTRGVHLDELLGFGPSTTNSAAAGFTYDTSGAFSNFNAVQVRLQKRMSRGLMFMARYTYSKSLDNASTIGGSGQTVIQNNADPRGDYGLSTFNMNNQFLGFFSYQLPFGDRQRFAARGWEKSVFGAFRVNGSFTAHSGAPYTIRINSKNPACQNVPGVNSERADVIGASSLANPSVQEWFNTGAFSVPTGCFGDESRNSIVGPGAFTINAGISKTIQFGRDGLRRLDFTWNATNLLNHVNYSGLSTVYGSPTFGQITGASAMRTMQFTTRVNF